jgi:hypothetical protein
MDEHEKLSRAKQKVEAMTGFYIHLAAFVAVNALLCVINILSGAPWWVQWPILGWGIGIIAHALAVFGSWPKFIANWQVRKIKELKDRM